MKKIILSVFIILTSLAIGILVYSLNKTTTLEYYSPYEAKAYVLSKDREMSFDIYTKDKHTLITNKDLNTYTLSFTDFSFLLEDVHIESFNAKDYSIIRIYSSLPAIGKEEYIGWDTTLTIQNSKYTLRLSYGSISFLKEETYPLLSISSLYGSYSYMNGSLILSGINIALTNDYSYLSSLRIGGIAYGTLREAEFDMALDNVIDVSKIIPSYSPKRVEESYIIALSSKKLFIPLGYKELSLLRSGYLILTLDTKSYYLDTFDFMTNLYDFEEYKNMMKKGEILYAGA